MYQNQILTRRLPSGRVSAKNQVCSDDVDTPTHYDIVCIEYHAVHVHTWLYNPNKYNIILSRLVEERYCNVKAYWIFFKHRKHNIIIIADYGFFFNI